MGRVSGKVALISGGARGMGASHARTLLSEGASVVIGDQLHDDGERLAEGLGANARYVPLDVTNLESWQDAVSATVDAFGSLDVLVNNAGIVTVGPIEEYPVESWQKMLDVNLTGVFLGIKAATPEITKSERGSIVNVSSVAGIQGYGVMSAYNASKYGVRGLTKSVAIDLAQHGVRVNSVHPGLIRTPMTEGADQSQPHVAMQRGGDPVEVSNLVLYLASDESSFSTGAEFVVDGGETAGLAQNQVFH